MPETLKSHGFFPGQLAFEFSSMVSQSLQSLYDVLQVDSDATFEQIKIAFKKRALEVHPDKGGSKEGFKKIMCGCRNFGAPPSDVNGL